MSASERSTPSDVIASQGTVGRSSGEPHYVVSDHRPAGVSNAQEVVPITRRSDTGGPRNGDHDVVAAVVILQKFKESPNVNGQLSDMLVDMGEQRRINALPHRWVHIAILDADEKLVTGSICKADAVLHQLGEIRRLAGHGTQRLTIKASVFHDPRSQL